MNYLKRLFGPNVLPQTTIITNDNIDILVQHFYRNQNDLPEDLKNIKIGKWDVSKVTNMSKLFYNKSGFDVDINDWDVSNVENMKEMFYGCTKFNSPLDKWNVSNVKNMSYMFFNCEKFNQPLNNWNVSSVGIPIEGDYYNEAMSHMFYRCKEFNQPLNNWDVSNVKDMTYMFFLCKKFDIENIKNWEVNSETDRSDMFGNTNYNDDYVKKFLPKKLTVTETENNMLDQSLATESENNMLDQSLATESENNMIEQSIPNKPILKIGKLYREKNSWLNLGNYIGQEPDGNGGYIYIFNNGKKDTKISNPNSVEEYFRFEKGKYYEITNRVEKQNYIYIGMPHFRPGNGESHQFGLVDENLKPVNNKKGEQITSTFPDMTTFTIKEIEEGDNKEGDNKEGDNKEGDNKEGDNKEGDNKEGGRKSRKRKSKKRRKSRKRVINKK